MGRKNLDRDGTFEPRVARAIHLAHATRAQRRLNLVRPELYASREEAIRAGHYSPKIGSKEGGVVMDL